MNKSLRLTLALVTASLLLRPFASTGEPWSSIIVFTECVAVPLGGSLVVGVISSEEFVRKQRRLQAAVAFSASTLVAGLTFLTILFGGTFGAHWLMCIR